MTQPASLLNWKRINTLIDMALEEDLGEAGDTTTKAVIPADVTASAVLLAKEELVCAGLEIAKQVFHAVDPELKWTPFVKDGDRCPKGTLLAKADGKAQSLLTAERTVLNFLQRLCGVATVSRRYAEAVGDSGKTQILDTRKTTPGWRNLEKYAVAIGGATNHRIGLFDRIMIKDNHREIAGFEGNDGITRSVKRARERYPQLEVQVEADTLEQLREAVEAGADYVLLDNMTDIEMAEAVKIASGKTKLEASGGITLPRIAEIAKLGVDFISAGALTHSVKASDISLDVIPSDRHE